ncbi:inheritance of peroxisomes protein 1-domain-containing protein [Lasiosphaeris hirsuta]|uniref:Inheritance of peroxisomes protein 1 n=1 Tax=Lasiosphaeris hirsuta TaxID=260670 RepID=A0AA40E715_9PEZI|nr:inheritance of peroxisomes protein 1-domain-containing protein [Lasiosphaeris hirsuta]
MEFSKPPGSAFQAPRRVFTAPIISDGQDQASPPRAPDGSVDTLYDHPSIKIVSFTAASRPPSFGPRSGITPQDVEAGTLPWSSPLERTIAVGAFRIYRAPGSVAFLSCGSALQPILPKSQVWCIDETSSKFVLQIRRPQYWRIELPVEDSEDLRRAELLREVFDKILQFEKTECPFKRTFTVDLPEPQTPTIKRPWTPAPGSSSSLPPTPSTAAEIARLHRGVVKGGANSNLERSMSLSIPSRIKSDRNAHLCLSAEETTLEQRNYAKATAIYTEAQRDEEMAAEGLDPDSPLQLRPSKMHGFQASRSIAAPPQLALVSTVHAGSVEEDTIESPSGGPASQPLGDSQDSFHTPQPFHSTPLPPSPPLSNPGSPFTFPCPPEVPRQPEEPTEQEDVSDTTVVSNASETWSTSPIASAPSEQSDRATTPSSVYDVDNLSACSPAKPEEQLPVEPTSPRSEEEPLATSMSAMSLSSQSKSSSGTPRRPYIRHRATTSSSISADRRVLSPLPPAANLFSPRQVYSAAAAVSASKLAVVRRLPMVVIQKTCEILMSPPSHLINLMLNVAARIAAGEWRGLVFGTDERGEQIPVHWDWSEEEDGSNNNNSSPSEGEYVGSGRQQYIDDDWPPRMGRKMAGSFPESDDEDSHSLASPMSEVGLSPTPDEVRHEDGAESLSRNPDLESDWSRSLGVD